MSRSGDFNIDYRAVNKLLGNSEPLKAYMVRRMSEAKAFVESVSPDGPPIGTGYVSSFQVELASFPDGVPLARLVNTDALWVVVEYGSGPRPQGGSSPAHHVFAQTLAYLEGG